MKRSLILVLLTLCLAVGESRSQESAGRTRAKEFPARKRPSPVLDVDSLIAAGSAFFRQADYASAIGSLEQVMAANPGVSTTVKLLLADSYARNGDTQRAITTLEEVNSTAFSPQAGYRLVQIYLRKGGVDQALRILDTLRARFPKDPATQYSNALFAETRGSIDDALGILEPLIRSGCEIAEAHAKLGQLYLEQGNVEGAIVVLGKAESLGLMTPQVHHLKAEAYYREGDFRAAKDEAGAALVFYRKAIERDPLAPDAYKNTGICYLIMNDLANADAEFLKYINRTKKEERSAAAQALGELVERGINEPDAKYLLKKHFADVPEPVVPAPSLTESGSGDMSPPVIVIVSPEDVRGIMIVGSESYRIRVAGLASDEKGVSLVRVNGVVASLTQPTSQEAADARLTGKAVKFVSDVMLTIGDNQLEIEAVDVAGNVAKRFLTIKRQMEATAGRRTRDVRLPTIWAVVVGVSRYEERDLELRFASKDAQSFYGFLKSPSGGSVPDKQIDLLLDRNATRAEIIQSINNKLRLAYEDDEVIIYIACHGIPDEVSGELYFLGCDADTRNIPGTGISQGDIQKAIATARTKKVLLIADACHSGTLGLSPDLAARGNVAYLTNKLLKGLTEVRGGVAMLTASSANEFSREGENWNGHGVFTYHLVHGLNGPADKDNDGVVTIRELHEYVYRMVADDTNGSQHPDLQGRFENQWPLSVVK